MSEGWAVSLAAGLFSLMLVAGGLFLRCAISRIEYDPGQRVLKVASRFLWLASARVWPADWFNSVTVRRARFLYSHSTRPPYEAFEISLTGPGEALFGLEPRVMERAGAIQVAQRYGTQLGLPVDDRSAQPATATYPPWGGHPPGECLPPKPVLPMLIDALQDLVQILEKDPNGRWTSHFRNVLDEARDLQTRSATPEELGCLSISILYVFGGAGSFGDYVPGVYDATTGVLAPLPGTERLEEASSRVAALAVDLRGQKSTHP
jgi:hypothetical protein